MSAETTPGWRGFATRPGAAQVDWTPRGDYRRILNLKSCELQHPAADELIADALKEVTPARIWGYPYQWGLVERLAEIHDVDPEALLLTAGSCSAIALVVDALAAPAGRILLQEPSFESWRHYSALRGVQRTRCRGLYGTPPAPTYDELLAALPSSPPAVVAVTNPGNPTGFVTPVEEMAVLAGSAAEHGHLLVIDECYAAFCGITHVGLVSRFPNVVVLRSLSKSWALAGARLAAVFSTPEIIRYLRRFRTDSPVSGPAVALAEALSHRLPELAAIWADVRRIRDEFAARVLTDQPEWTALRPGANFVTFATGTAGEGSRLEEALRGRGIRGRGLDTVDGMAGCLRLSLADRERMGAVADVLAELA